MAPENQLGKIPVAIEALSAGWPEVSNGPKERLAADFIESIVGIHKECSFWVIWIRAKQGITWQFGLCGCGIAVFPLVCLAVHRYVIVEVMARQGPRLCFPNDVGGTLDSSTHSGIKVEIATLVCGKLACHIENELCHESPVDSVNPNRLKIGLLVKCH